MTLATEQATEKPVLTDLLTQPRRFFQALSTLPPKRSRYVWLVLLTGLIAGAYSALSQRGLNDALATIPGYPSGAFALVTGLIGSPIALLIGWLLLWGLGSLGAGKEGRAGEVFGAGFLPSLIASLLLLPLSVLLPPQVTTAAPNFSGLEGEALGKAIQTYTAAVQAELGRQPITIIGNVLNYAAMAWQFYLAYIGFGVLTGDRSKATRGALIPLGVSLLLGGALWLLGRAVQGLAGGGA